MRRFRPPSPMFQHAIAHLRNSGDPRIAGDRETRDLPVTMPRLTDMMLVPHISTLLTAWLAPKDIINLLVWAIENDLCDGASQLLVMKKTDTLQEDTEGLQSRLLRCAAASGCRVAFARLLQDTTNAKMPALFVITEELLPAGVVYEAAKRGDLSTIKWLSSFVAFEPHEAMAFAAANGYLSVAWWIGQHAKKTDPVLASELEIHSVGDSALAWSAPATTGGHTYINYFATRTSGLSPIQRSNTRDFIGAMDIAAAEGDLLLLQLLHDDPEYVWSCTPSAIDEAASLGHLDVLQWLTENRSEGCTQAAMDSAARHGHVATMAYLRDQHSLTGLSSSTFLTALKGGSLDVLAWLQSHTTTSLSSLFPVVSRSCLVEAACVSPNRLRVLQWLDDVLDIRFATYPAMSVVLSQGDAVTAQWLADPMGDGANLAHWDGVVAKWMSYEFALWHSSTFAKAAVNGHLPMLEWLAYARSFHRVETDTLWQCAGRGHLHIVQFILQRPLHQPKDLVFVPPAWTSFCDSVEDSHTEHPWCCAWDRLACDPPWARRYVELWLQYRPSECQQVAWLTEWAVHCGYRHIYEQLLRACGDR